MKTQVQRLYSFHKLLWILDRLQHYHTNPKHTYMNVDRGFEKIDLII
jgi:hypothetical protein